MRLRLKASELRQISIRMGEAPLQFRHLLLPVFFSPFFDAVKARFEDHLSSVFLWGDSPLEKNSWLSELALISVASLST